MGEVVRVVDGDTIRVRVGARGARALHRHRHARVSAPGMGVECFARRAAAENERLVGGRRVRLERDAEERDRFGRLLAYVCRGATGAWSTRRSCAAATPSR